MSQGDYVGIHCSPSSFGVGPNPCKPSTQRHLSDTQRAPGFRWEFKSENIQNCRFQVVNYLLWHLEYHLKPFRTTRKTLNWTKAAATIEMEMIQNERATVLLGLRNPYKLKAMLPPWSIDKWLKPKWYEKKLQGRPTELQWFSKEVHINLSESNRDQSKSKSVWASQNSVT